MNPDVIGWLRSQIATLSGALGVFEDATRAAVEQQISQLQQQLEAAEAGEDVGLAGILGGAAPSAPAASGDKFLPYRGDIRGLAAVGNGVAFVTAHPEGQPTALYRLDADSLKLSEQKLPCGGTAVAVQGTTVLVGGSDRHLYVGTKPLGDPLPGEIRAIAPVSGDRLAVVAGANLVMVSRNDGSVLQTLPLPEPGTVLAADRTGQWLAVGTERGTVAVFDGQDKPEFEPAESDRLHDGAVTALLFEADDLRFFSAGADHKLFSTHARGRLEPEDKGRDNAHEDAVTGLAWSPTGDRLLSAGRDGVLKSWPRVGGVKPALLKDAVATVVAVAVVAGNRPRLAVACEDNSVRFIDLDAEGRFGDVRARAFGAVDRAKAEFGFANDFKRREKALKDVAAWEDAAAVELLAARMDADGDHQLRLLAAQLLAKCPHPKAAGALEPALNHRDDKVRVEAFGGLRAKRGTADLGPLDLALKTGKPDVGVLAVQALEPLAAKDDQALARLTAALDHAAWDVRRAALGALPSVFAADPPMTGLTALGSKFGDVRAGALGWFYHRKLLADPRVLSAVRRRLEDDDATVRKVAFLASVLARWGLANFLRKADPELHRQLNELQGSDTPIEQVPASNKQKLGPDDYDVSLQATAARALDTCLRGARALAVLGDPRAFGLLLQLSREDDAPARVEVCRALAALGDPRAATRLRSLLFDPDASVRDAAYSALAKIEPDPLAAASSGLTAIAEDVRRRGLQTLVESLRAGAGGDGPLSLLSVALNDPAAGVRLEAWKAALNLKVGGDGEPTLRFALKSVHPDVRREVLTELTARLAEPWATPLLYEFLNDPDAAIRAEAFEHATRKTKELAPLEAALGSRFPDARRLAIDAAIKKRTKPAQALLLRALHDPDRDLRQLAISALVDEDAVPALKEAAGNEHPDVRVRAAAALAAHGDPSALKPLLELATAEEPEQRERQSAWLDVAEAALHGLAELADSAVVEPVQFVLSSKHERLRAAAAWAVARNPGPAAGPALRAALSHADRSVRAAAAFGLAARGDAGVLAQLLSDEFAAEAGAGRALAAAVALGPAGERLAATFLDSSEESVRRRAVLIHLLLELRDPAGTAARLLECLSARAPRTRLLGAQGLELYSDPAAFRDFVAKAVNDRGDETAWKVPPETVDALAAVLASGPPLLKVRAVALLGEFAEKEQAGFNAAWAVFSKRFAADVARLVGQPGRTGSALSAASLRELAFGAYVGLVREQGTAASTPAVVRVRQTALSRAFAVASADAGYSRAVRPVFAQALSDPNQPVRTQAFEHLLALGTDRARLGADALEAGFTDLAVKGLELLAAGSADGDAVLERVALGRTDNLAAEAAKLLVARRGPVPVAAACLEAASEPLRTQAVQWLAAESEKSAEAKDKLRSALTSRYRKVREAAAFELAGKKDAAAFDALVQLLRDAEFPKKQAKAVEALTQLGDPRAADAFLDRIEHDPSGTADVDSLIQAAGAFRRPETVDRLFALADRKKEWRDAAFLAVRAVSGFDQDVDLPEDDEAGFARLEREQHPRRPDVLARLLDKAVAAGDDELTFDLVNVTPWARGPAVDAVLASLVASPEENVRHAAIEAVAVRARRRGGPTDPLIRPLKHKDPTTQFLAAEGLAKAGRPEGVNVLLSAIEYLDDVGMRERAVLALGELGDVRAVDVLLRLASEDGHALQEAAAEAVGHLRRAPAADKIGRLLERLAKGDGGVALRAFVGLRWFGTDAAWKLLRQRAADRNEWQVRQGAAEQLGFHDDPANRDVLLKLLRTDDDHDVLEAAFRSARRLWGDDLAPHLALLEHPEAGEFAADRDRFGEDVLKTACDRGDVLRLLEVFPRCSAEVQAVLEASLSARDVPASAAAAGLGSTDSGTVRLAARLLARAGAADAATGKAVAAAVAKWLGVWADRRAKLDREPTAAHTLPGATDALRALCWAAARTGAGADKLAELATSRPDDVRFRPVRAEAVRCLATVSPTAAVLKALEAVARGTDPEARELAADLLARHDPKRAAALVEPLASDRPSFARLTGKGVPAATAFVKAAAKQVHYQPVALPALIAAKDVDALAAVAKDRKASEAARLGAVEGLGAMAAEPAERALAAVGAADGDDEDVRKAAWRALRRSKRARAKVGGTK